ncbi:hypothetical protein HELRODRAFT_179455 [Helobdella robusta]|uniref:Uncharacterized protein n=1 Tax=Helobdella robusta TaxID=6412 RepID=T1FEQ9_HELRO|nr:hypothetical protein HELRODRAFT_179455 [Helobdella robusta]ESN95386.1 hypothetical protein HELRODRAFT_179455 [Helobdella robusta]
MLEIFSLLFLFVSVSINGNGVLSLDASYNPRTGHAAKRSNDANNSTLLVFHEDLLERRVKSSDVIFIGTIVKLDDKNKIINDAQNILTKNYSNDNEVVDSSTNESEYFTLFYGNPKLIDSDGNVNLMRKKEEIGRKKMMGMVEVERVLKGGYLLSLMPRYGRITKDDLGRGISSKKWVLVHDINKFGQKLKKRTLKKMHLNNNNNKIANNNNNEQLKVNDTKIFFLKEMQPQMLHLNSSLIDDTANNVKMLEYVVRKAHARGSAEAQLICYSKNQVTRHGKD